MIDKSEKNTTMRTCDCGGTAYTTDLKSVGESLRVQIPPIAPKNVLYKGVFSLYKKKPS